MLRFGMTCTAATCAAGALVATLTNCEDDPNDGNGVKFDGSVPSFDAPPGSDVAPIPLPEAGPDAADAAVGCAPASMAGFVPPAYVPAAGQNFSCNDYQQHSQTLALANVCFATSSTLADCNAFPDASVLDGATIPPACGTCLRKEEADIDGGYGASIRGTITVANVAGCVEIADDTDAGAACARAIQAAAVCVDRSCRTSCPVTNDATRAAYIACTKLAATTSCLSFAQAATACTNTEIDAGDRARDFCFSSTNPVLNFDKIAAFFCTS